MSYNQSTAYLSNLIYKKDQVNAATKGTRFADLIAFTTQQANAMKYLP